MRKKTTLEIKQENKIIKFYNYRDRIFKKMKNIRKILFIKVIDTYSTSRNGKVGSFPPGSLFKHLNYVLVSMAIRALCAHLCGSICEHLLFLVWPKQVVKYNSWQHRMRIYVISVNSNSMSEKTINISDNVRLKC